MFASSTIDGRSSSSSFWKTKLAFERPIQAWKLKIDESQLDSKTKINVYLLDIAHLYQVLPKFWKLIESMLLFIKIAKKRLGYCRTPSDTL